MLRQQRQHEILNRLGSAGGVRVAELAKALKVTEETIRRDLEQLDAEGKLRRTHGGAVPTQENGRNPSFDVRKVTNLEQKVAIARTAAPAIREGDVIGLDVSTTTYELAQIIPDIPLTVITNSVPVVLALMSRTHVRVVSTGGDFDSRARSFTGSLAEQALSRFNINKLFLSSKGVDLSRGLSDATDSQARVKRAMMDIAEETCLLADHSKFGQRSVVFFAGLDEIDRVITNAGVDEAVLRDLSTAVKSVETAE